MLSFAEYYSVSCTVPSVIHVDKLFKDRHHNVVSENRDSDTWVYFLSTPLTSYIALCKLLNFSVSQFPHL